MTARKSFVDSLRFLTCSIYMNLFESLISLPLTIYLIFHSTANGEQLTLCILIINLTFYFSIFLLFVEKILFEDETIYHFNEKFVREFTISKTVINIASIFLLLRIIFCQAWREDPTYDDNTSSQEVYRRECNPTDLTIVLAKVIFQGVMLMFKIFSDCFLNSNGFLILYQATHKVMFVSIDAFYFFLLLFSCGKYRPEESQYALRHFWKHFPTSWFGISCFIICFPMILFLWIGDFLFQFFLCLLYLVLLFPLSCLKGGLSFCCCSNDFCDTMEILYRDIRNKNIIFAAFLKWFLGSCCSITFHEAPSASVVPTDVKHELEMQAELEF
jgi:magnesium-transporting ATPase (P-type)